MDDAPDKLLRDSTVALFGQESEAFARYVATARQASRTDPRGFRNRAAWQLDPRVLAALIALDEDR